MSDEQRAKTAGPAKGPDDPYNYSSLMAPTMAMAPQTTMAPQLQPMVAGQVPMAGQLPASDAFGSGVGGMSADERKFLAADTDGDGFVSEQEAANYLKYHAVAVREKRDRHHRRRPRFHCCLSRRPRCHRRPLTARSLDARLCQDADGDGKIDLQELVRYLKPLDDHNVQSAEWQAARLAQLDGAHARIQPACVARSPWVLLAADAVRSVPAPWQTCANGSWRRWSS